MDPDGKPDGRNHLLFQLESMLTRQGSETKTTTQRHTEKADTNREEKKRSSRFYVSTQSSITWRGLWPLWLDHHFSPSSKDGGPHAVVERMCCQAEELVAAVSAQTVDEQRQVHGHHPLAQQHVESRLVLLPRRHQEGNQRRHTCRHAA